METLPAKIYHHHPKHKTWNEKMIESWEDYRRKLNLAMTCEISACHVSMIAIKVIEIQSKTMPRKIKKFVRKKIDGEFERFQKLADKYQRILVEKNILIDNFIEQWKQ